MKYIMLDFLSGYATSIIDLLPDTRGDDAGIISPCVFRQCTRKQR